MQYRHPPPNAAYPIVRVGYPSPEYGCAPLPPECGCMELAKCGCQPLVPECGCESTAGLGAFDLTINWPQAALGALVGVGLGYVLFATK